MTIALSSDLIEFMESGVSMLVGTRDAALRPDAVRAYGVAVSPDRRGLTVYVPDALAARALANIADNPQVAVMLSRPIDHRALQVKGTVRAMRASGPEDRAIQERYLAAFVEQLYCVQLPRALTRRLHYFPSTALELEIADLFMQTPGPGAGRRFEQTA
jgi:hypothetical protein